MFAKRFLISSFMMIALTAVTACSGGGTGNSPPPIASSSSSSSISSVSSSSSSSSSVSSSSSSSSSSVSSSSSSSSVAALTVTSSGFLEGAKIPAKFTCDGTNVNPQLTWANVPSGTQSFAIIVDDPDAFAAFGVVWVHWNAHNVPATATQIAEAASNNSSLMPAGTTEDVSDFGSTGYRGPCPPSGSHNYHYAVYALNKVSISLAAPSTRDEFEAAHVADILAKGELTGFFR